MERRMFLRFVFASVGAAAGVSASPSRAFFNPSRGAAADSGVREAPSEAVATPDDMARARVEKTVVRSRRRCYYYRRYGTIRRHCID